MSSTPGRRSSSCAPACCRPGLSSGLILRGDEGTVTVLTWWGLRTRVRQALVEAEVAFFERATWLSIGWTEGANGARARAVPGPAVQ